MVGGFLRLFASCSPHAGEAETRRSEGELNEKAQAACTGSELTEAPELPTGWPEMGEVTFTQQSDQGPTKVVEGYFDGDIKAAHDDFKRELSAAGFTILFDESRKRLGGLMEGPGPVRPGRDPQGVREHDKMYVHVTNRPA